VPANTYLTCKTDGLEYTHKMQETLESIRRKLDNVVKNCLEGDGDLDALCEARKIQVEIMELAQLSISQVLKFELL